MIDDGCWWLVWLIICLVALISSCWLVDIWWCSLMLMVGADDSWLYSWLLSWSWFCSGSSSNALIKLRLSWLGNKFWSRVGGRQSFFASRRSPLEYLFFDLYRFLTELNNKIINDVIFCWWFKFCTQTMNQWVLSLFLTVNAQFRLDLLWMWVDSWVWNDEFCFFLVLNALEDLKIVCFLYDHAQPNSW